MYDAVDVADIPADAAAAAAYNDRSYQTTYPALCRRFPHLLATGRLVSIAGNKTTIARIYDLEQGNPMTPADVPGAVRRAIAAGVYRPGPYGSAQTLAACEAELLTAGLHPSEYVLWLALWDGLSVIPHRDAAKQERSTGRYDVSVCLPGFFPPQHAATPHGTVRVELVHDLAGGGWDHQDLPGNPTWGPDEEYDEVAVGVCRGGQHAGQWRTVPLQQAR